MRRHFCTLSHPLCLVFTGLLLLGLLGSLPGLVRADTLTTLYSFSAGFNNSDGRSPRAALIQANDGNFYGTCPVGGVNDNGAIIKITPAGAFTTLYSFSAVGLVGNTDGSFPEGSLIQASDGNLYGTANEGGVNGTGTIFKITPSGSFTTLYTFSAATPTPPYVSNADGAWPGGGLVQASDGNLYGTTSEGGPNGTGTIFKITPSGSFTTLYSFSATSSQLPYNMDGCQPFSSLIQASDGNLYGTTREGGVNGTGTIFRITLSGTFTTLHNFGPAPINFPTTNTDGAGPTAGLIQASDGNLYGTAPDGGANCSGTIYKITLSGAFTTLYSFSLPDNSIPTFASSINDEGWEPAAKLIQARDGNLYGSCAGGGANGTGTLFRITLEGVFTAIYTFSAASEDLSNVDGVYPDSLIQANDGNLYGTADYGGSGANGTIFKITLPLSQRLLLHNPTSGQLATWSLKNTKPINGSYLSPSQNPAWKPVGMADFNGDANADLLFQNSATGQLAVWFLHDNKATDGRLLSLTPQPGWKAVGVADFNGDGQPDVLFQNTSTGQLAIWDLIGTTVTTGAYVTMTPPSGWMAVGLGDFNNDGHPDLLLQNKTSGQLAVWYLNKNTVIDGTFITPVQQAGWQCVGVADLNGDGWPDLVFQNTSTGKLVYWLLHGAQAVDGNAFSAQPLAGWQVSSAH